MLKKIKFLGSLEIDGIKYEREAEVLSELHDDFIKRCAALALTAFRREIRHYEKEFSHV